MKGRKKKDITVRFIPNLLEDKGRILQSFPYDRTWTIRRYLKESKVCFKDMRIIVNSNKEIKNLSTRLQIGDEILVFPNISFTAIATWWAAATFWQGVALVVGVLSAAYAVYSAFTGRSKMPSFDTIGDGMDTGSPSASWTGVKTVREPGGSVPIICGKRLTGGTVINEYISTDGDKNYLNSLIAIGEGKLHSITLKRINKNNASNFTNYTIETRLGTNDQAVIPNFEDLHDLHALNVPLLKDTPYIYTTQSSDVEAFEARFTLPCVYQQDASGTLSAWEVICKIEYKIHTDTEYTNLGNLTINAKSGTELRRIFRKVGITAAQIDIRFTRTSDDSSLEPYKTGNLYLSGVDEINTDDLAYPNTGVVGVKTLAIDQLSGDDPEYEFEVEGVEMLMPKVMNGAVEVGWEDYYWDPVAMCYKLFADDTILIWDGETYVVVYSANPIWFLYYLTINTRYGMGDSIVSADHDLDYLLEMSQYCDERVPDGEGGWEKRFRLDVCIDSPQKSLDLLMQLSDTFRGLPFYSDNGKIRIAIRKPDLPVQLFGMGNIVEGSFSQAWTSKRDIPNIVYIQYDNKDNYYQSEKISVIDPESLEAGKAKNKKDLRYPGTKLSYAIRYGRDYIKAAKYSSGIITFKSGMGAAIRQCGEVIDVAHDVPQWGFSGKILANNTTTKVKLDREVVIEATKSYAIRIDFAKPNDDGSPRYEEKVITDPPGTYTEVNVSEEFSTAPAEFDNYSFGELDKIVFPARIMSFKRQRMGEAEVEASIENDLLYDDSAVIIPQRKLSSLSLDLPSVESLKLTEGMVLAKDGTVLNVIDVWFRKPDPMTYKIRRYEKARIFLSDDGGLSWAAVGETYSDSYSIAKPLTDGVEYIIAVASVGSDNSVNPVDISPQDTITLLGDTIPPQDVSSFLINQSRDRLYMGWVGVTNVNLSGYEIRYGESWETGYVIVADYKGTSLVRLDFRTGDNQSFWIKSKNRSGKYSLNATEAILSVDSIPFTNVIDSYNEHTGWAGTKTNVSKVGNNLELNTGQLTGTYTCPVRDNGFVATTKIGIEDTIVDASSPDKMNDSATERMNDSPTERMSGREIVGASTFEIRISEDGGDPDTDEWTDWKPWQPGDYKCRWYQIRMTLTRANDAIVVQCSQLTYYSDLPDVDEAGEVEITDANTGFSIVFEKNYHKVPRVAFQVLSGDGRVIVYTQEPDLTDCAGNAKDLSGVNKTGRVSYNVHGV